MSGYAWPARRWTAADAGRAARDVAIGALAAGAVGLLVGVHAFYALLIPAVLAVVWLAVRPRPVAVVLGASIPAVQSVAGGHVGVHLGVSDLLLLLLVFAAAGAAVLERDGSTFTALRPVRLPVLQYCVLVLLLLVAHHEGFGALTQTLQRYELIAFPLVAGSYLALRGAEGALLKAYVVAATVLALVFPFDSFGLQKNPAGQFIAGAILLLVGLPRLGRYRILAPLLVYGLFATQSRGSMLACAVGIAVLLALRFLHSPRQAIAIAFGIVAIAVPTFKLMPASAQAFITTYQTQVTNTNYQTETANIHAAWNIRYRQEYWHDAMSIIRAHPWLGVGVGAYANADQSLQPPPGAFSTSDPHNVVLLQAAEGGWLFAASFVVLILGTGVALVRLRRIELAPVALAVVLANVVHGLLDVYWVRGTPVLGWLLVGMACAATLRSPASEPEQP